MELLTEKYRPKKIEDLVLINKEFGDKLKSWKETGDLTGHILLYGPPGTGKSSTVSVILNELNVSDYITVNGSDKTGVDDTRRVIEYASVPPIEGCKIVVFEEFERLSQQAQDSLKYILEKYSSWCKFIFTTNNINKVTQAIISRCEVYPFTHLDVNSFATKIVSILKEEQIGYEEQDIIEYIKSSYPDLRKCINLINQNTVDNKLVKLNKDSVISIDGYKLLFDFVNGKETVLDTQKFLATGIKDEDFDTCYKVLYNNLQMITQDMSKWEDCLIIIASYLSKNNIVAFKDLNLMGCLCEIKKIICHK